METQNQVALAVEHDVYFRGRDTFTILAQESKSLENITLDNLNNRNMFFVYLFVSVICTSILTLV